MFRLLATVAVAFCVVTAASAQAAGYRHHHRSRWVTEEFEKENPCPSTGRTRGACPGWIKDHIVPLCKGGADAVWNLQWQTTTAAKAKDKWECK
jgi:hypothetical protein